MKTTLSLLILLTWGAAWAAAQEVTTVQVAPSDQVIYPDASQILNKTDPKVTAQPAAKPLPAALPSAKPLVGATPVPAKTAKVVAAVPDLPPPARGWYLRWTLTGDEAGARAWAASLGATTVTALGADLWEVLSGPLGADGLKRALEGQAGKAELVKR